jgi:hypothetical protein
MITSAVEVCAMVIAARCSGRTAGSDEALRHAADTTFSI